MPEAAQAPLSQPGTVFVGRERELALLRAALADTTGGHGRLVLLGGEPGSFDDIKRADDGAPPQRGDYLSEHWRNSR